MLGDVLTVGLSGWFLFLATGVMRIPLAGFGVLACSGVIGLYLVEAYEDRIYREHEGLPTRLMIAIAVVAGFAGIAAFAIPTLGFTRQVAAGYFLFHVPTLVIWRLGGASLVRRALKPRRVAIVGSGQEALDLVEAFAETEAFELGAVIGTRATDLFVAGQSIPVERADLSALADTLARHRVQMVAVAVPEEDRQGLFEQLVICRYRGIEVQDVATCFEMLRHRLPVKYLEDGWVAFSSRFMGWGHDFEEKLKRLMDVCVASTVLVVVSPLMLVITLAVRLSSRGPAVFRQARVGRGGRVFTLLKFRSMRLDAEMNGAVWAEAADPRATPLGAFLRKSHLDELPQLFNVLRGDMSLVGPRPERPEFVAQLSRQIPYYDLRHIVKPGVTGWAQICYPYGASVRDAEAKLEYDLYYLRHKDLLWDLRIILRTVTVSVLGRGSR